MAYYHLMESVWVGSVVSPNADEPLGLVAYVWSRPEGSFYTDVRIKRGDKLIELRRISGKDHKDLRRSWKELEADLTKRGSLSEAPLISSV